MLGVCTEPVTAQVMMIFRDAMVVSVERSWGCSALAEKGSASGSATTVFGICPMPSISTRIMPAPRMAGDPSIKFLRELVYEVAREPPPAA